MDELYDILCKALDHTNTSPSVEWSIGVNLKDGNKWYYRIYNGMSSFQSSLDTSLQDILHKSEPSFVMFKAKKTGDDHMSTFDDLTSSIFNTLLDMRKISSFELKHKKKIHLA